MEQSKGLNDRPISNLSEDIFGVKQYIDGLQNFICHCNTPMTIAIQGSWGTGKTSFMNMIKGEDDERILPVWFNTWQFSQFNLGDSLPITLIDKLISTLPYKKGNAQKIVQGLAKLSKIILHSANGVAVNFLGSDIKEAIEENSDNQNVVEIITELKREFQTFINDNTERGQKRVVIFIDDLDRLEPKRAIEVLEVLKIFLDCENCVFVLAIDYNVVCKGIKQKYGEDFDEDKGKNFFDKIIQVPFKMPVMQYQIDKYVRANLPEMMLDDSNIKIYKDLIYQSIGYNPRGMKRIFNAFLLLTMIYNQDELNTAQSQLILFAFLCLQLSYEEVYNYIISNHENIMTSKQISDYSKDKIDDTEHFISSLDALTAEDQEKAKDFFQTLCLAILNGERSLSTEKEDILQRVLSASMTTANAINQGEIDLSIEKEYSYRSIDEEIDLTKFPTGWVKCKVNKIKICDNEIDVANFTDVVAQTLKYFITNHRDRFEDVHNQPEEHKLSSFFYGKNGKDGPLYFKSSKLIPGTTIKFDTNNGNKEKINLLKRLLTAMELQPSQLQLSVRFLLPETEI